MRTPLADIVGSCVIGAAIFAALVRASTSHPFHVPGPATPAQTHQVYAEAVEKEPGERADASRRFRGSPWSADDDFHSKETKRVKDFAKGHDVTVASLLNGLDEGMRQHWPTASNNVPNPKVMPCRPRLVY
jgi:hypothetical protein